MVQDVNGICVQGARVARCMSQLFVFEKRYKEALNALMLARSLKQRVWDGSQYELKQLAGVGMVTAKVQWTKCLPLNLSHAEEETL